MVFELEYHYDMEGILNYTFSYYNLNVNGFFYK